MRKKLALPGILLFISFFFWAFYSAPEKAEESLEPGTFSGEVRQAEKLLGTLSRTLDTGRVHLCFRGEELACDRKSGIFYLPVDMDSGIWENGAFTNADEDIRILPLEDYTLVEKRQAVAEGRPFLFLAWDGKEQTCTSVQVVFTGLPVVCMETDADLDKDAAFAGNAVFYENCGKEDWVSASAFQAHERGQTTRAYPKKGYRVNLITVTSTGVVNENKESVFGMRDSDSWIFYAIYSDGTKVRDKFNTELWNKFGAVNTPFDAHFGTHMEYAELIVNGEYRGLYGIFEPIDSSQLQISDQEYLYKRTFGRELLSDTFDSLEPEEYLGALGMEIKGRDGAGSREDWMWFRRYIMLCEADDREFEEEAPRLLDMDNMADIWLYLQMLYGEDNIYKNMFFAFKKEPGTGGYRLYLVPWDTDLSWGNVYVDDKKELYATFAPDRSREYLEWPLADRILSLNAGGFRELVKERFSELRENVLSGEEMEKLLEECIHQVQDSGAFARDAARWPDSRHDGNYEGMREFMKNRMDFLNEMIQE